MTDHDNLFRLKPRWIHAPRSDSNPIGQCTTNLATFRAIAKKCPHKSAQDVLLHLVASQPGAEGKWFAAAKDAGLFDLAIELVTRSPADPRTLVRAARDFAAIRPDFAIASGMAALRWISLGRGA